MDEEDDTSTMKIRNLIIKPVKAIVNAISTAIFLLLILTAFTIMLIGIIASVILAAIPGIIALAQIVLSVQLSSNYDSMEELFEELD